MPCQRFHAPGKFRTPGVDSARGLTLLELLMVMLIAAILLSAGQAGLRRLLLEAAMVHQVNAFVRTVHLARQTAQLKTVPVAICPARRPDHCEPGGDWSAGWLAFVNHDRDHPPQRDPAEPVLAMQAAWRAGTISANRRAFAFRPFSIRDTNGTVRFCDERGPAAGRAVVISPTGRPRLSALRDLRSSSSCGT